MPSFPRFLSALFATPRSGAPFLVLRDLDSARETIATALAAADDRTRPGLEEAARLLTGLAPDDDELAGAWALRTLRAAGADPAGDKVVAVRELRRAEPGLSLSAAVRLMQLAQQQG